MLLVITKISNRRLPFCFSSDQLALELRSYLPISSVILNWNRDLPNLYGNRPTQSTPIDPVVTATLRKSLTINLQFFFTFTMVGWMQLVETLNHLNVQDHPSAPEVLSSFACFLHARSFKESKVL